MFCCSQVAQTYISPHLEGGRVNLVELVEIAVNDGVLWQTVLGASRDNDGAGHLLPSGGFIIDLQQRSSQRCLKLKDLQCFCISYTLQLLTVVHKPPQCTPTAVQHLLYCSYLMLCAKLAYITK